MIPSRGVASALFALALVSVSARAAAKEPASSPMLSSTAAPEKGYRDLLTDDDDGRLDGSELVYERDDADDPRARRLGAARVTSSRSSGRRRPRAGPT